MNYPDMEAEGDSVLLSILSKFLHRDMEVLEVGCGTTDILTRLKRKYRIKGLCADPYGYGNDVIRVPAEEIERMKMKFDLIYLIRTLHHLNARKFASSSYSTLKKGGYLIIVDWKKGTDTGVPEKYFSLNQAIKIFSQFSMVEKGELKWNFYLVLEKP